MVKTLIAGLLVALMGGLGWLDCNYPHFAIRVILVLLAVTILLHLGIKAYQRGWHDRSAVTKAISDTVDNRCPINKSAEVIFFLVEAALVLLLLFAVAFIYYPSPKI